MLPVWLVLAGLQLAQPHCESPGQACWGSRHGSDLPLRTCSVTRALSLSPLRAAAFYTLPQGWQLGGPWIGRATAISPRDEPTLFLVSCNHVPRRYFPRHLAPPLGQADRTPPPRWDAYTSGSTVLSLRLRTHSYTLSHCQDPYPFSKPPIPMLAPSSPHPVRPSCPPRHPHANSHTAQHTSVASLLLLLYTQLPSSHIPLSNVCLPLCNSSCSTLQYGSGLYNLLIRFASLSDRGPGVPESPHYLPLIPTASP